MDTKPPECWACYNPRLGLRVELTPDHSSVLPYEHFIYSEYVDREGEEVLKLVFATHEILLNGNLLRRVEVALLLRAFIVNQRDVLRLWIGDVAAQITEKLAEKYPGQVLTRVADALVNRLTQIQSHCHTMKPGEEPKHTRGMRI